MQDYPHTSNYRHTDLSFNNLSISFWKTVWLWNNHAKYTRGVWFLVVLAPCIPGILNTCLCMTEFILLSRRQMDYTQYSVYCWSSLYHLLSSCVWVKTCLSIMAKNSGIQISWANESVLATQPSQRNSLVDQKLVWEIQSVPRDLFFFYLHKKQIQADPTIHPFICITSRPHLPNPNIVRTCKSERKIGRPLQNNRGPWIDIPGEFCIPWTKIGSTGIGPIYGHRSIKRRRHMGI